MYVFLLVGFGFGKQNDLNSTITRVYDFNVVLHSSVVANAIAVTAMIGTVLEQDAIPIALEIATRNVGEHGVTASTELEVTKFAVVML